MSTRGTGDIGEEIAARYLQKNGFRILERNFTVRFGNGPLQGEIDIIAKKGNSISFVEVKTAVQNGSSPWAPEDRVHSEKQRKIRRAAEVWLDTNAISEGTLVQVDVVAVTMPQGKTEALVRYFPNVGEW